MVFVLHIDRTEELNLVLRMLETLKTGEYTIRRLSAVLGFSTYSGRLQKTTLWDKLQNNGVFTPTERSSGNAVIYYFDWRRKKGIPKEWICQNKKEHPLISEPEEFVVTTNQCFALLGCWLRMIVQVYHVLYIVLWYI